MNFGYYMKLPLINTIKKRDHRDVALFQDVLIRIIYEIDNTAEIHGGTAIWRCYGGKRFSKDIDIYISSKVKRQEFKKRITKTAEKYNAEVIKLKDTGNLLFIELLLDNIYSEIDINYKKYYDDPVIREYENIDGTVSEVLTLPPEILTVEKIEAYKDRKYITDLYDIRILVDYADIKPIKKQLENFVSTIEIPKNYKKAEAALGNLIYGGPIPTFKSMVNYIQRRIS